MGALGALALLLTGCFEGPQSTFQSAGTFARKADNLFNSVFIIVVVVFVLVEGAIVFFCIKYRARPKGPLPVQIHGHTRAEAIWTIIPAVILAGVAIPTVRMVFEFDKAPPASTRLNVGVVGHQWWWEYDYKDASGKTLFSTANEMHIPIKRAVYASLNSVDVIHSFWIPRLAGKQDVNPGHTNHLNIEADQTGTFLGQCSQFCGLSHANMRLRVIAQTPEDFQAWVTAQETAAAAPTDALAQQGQQLFLTGRNGAGTFGSASLPACSSCHTIGGTPAAGTFGPNLTHVFARQAFAGDTLDMNPDNLKLWLENPQKEKPGATMPNLHLTSDEVTALVAYLQTLS